MGNGEDFLLKWNDHHTLFFAGAEELCESEEYTDVTLAAGQQFFSAHKLVLSICSPFFRALFKRLGAHKSVIFLKDVEPKHLELLLEYMYKGEIKVQESELVNVLNAAQSLEIKGLTDSSSSSGQKSESNKSSKTEAPRPSSKRPSPAPAPHHTESPARKRPKPTELPAPAAPVVAHHPAPVVNVKEEQEVIPVGGEGEEEWAEPGGGGGTVAGYTEEGGEYSNTLATGYEEMGGYEGEEYYGETEEGMMNLGEGDDRACFCPQCGKGFSTKYNLKIHNRTVHEQLRLYKCYLCNREFTQNSSLNRHVKSNHTAA